MNRNTQVWQEKMPTGFAVSRNVLSHEEAIDALVLAVKIAFGEHGYGPEYFSEIDPLSLVYVMRESQDFAQSEEMLRKELEDCYEKIVEEIPEARGKIYIEGFRVPEATAEEILEVAAS